MSTELRAIVKDEIEEVSAYEVNSLMSDEEAEALVEASDREVDRSKKVIVNVDTLSMYFKDGEIVTFVSFS